MYKELSSTGQTRSYLAMISNRRFVVEISTNGELLDIKPYHGDKVESSSSKRIKIELG